jgi:uncharacterized membrane protein
MAFEDILERFLLATHATAGGIVLISGLLAMLAKPKGGNFHKKSGRVFYFAMVWIFISALLTLILFRFKLFMLVIAAFSFYMAFSGRRVLKRKNHRRSTSMDQAVAILAMAAGIILVSYGMFQLFNHGDEIGSILSIVFGFLTFNVSFTDYRGMTVRTSRQSKMWWWYRHMSRMLGAYIAASTAFLVVNGSTWFGERHWLWMLWLIPTIIGTPLISYWISRYRKSFRDA